MKYIYLSVALILSIIFMFGIALPYLISEKDTFMVLSGLGLMIVYCLGLIHISVKILFPKTIVPSTEEKTNEK